MYEGKRKKKYFKQGWADFETTVNKDSFYKRKINVARAVRQMKDDGEIPDGFIPPQVYSWNVKFLLKDLVEKQYKKYGKNVDRHSFKPIFSPILYENNKWKVFYKKEDWEKHIEITPDDILKWDDFEEMLKSDKCYIDFTGIRMDNFIELIYQLLKIGKFQIFFHNGGNFDAHFMMTNHNNDVLNKLLQKDYQNNFQIETDKKFDKKDKPEYYISTMVNKTKKIYDITYHAGKNAVRISDNNLLFQGSIKGFGESLSLLHQKRETDKGKDYWDNIYNKKVLKNYRYVKVKNKKKLKKVEIKRKAIKGYQRFELYKDWEEFFYDGNELEYLMQDTFVLAEYQKFMQEIFPRKKWKMTAGASAYHNWKAMFSEKLLNEEIKLGNIQEIKLERGLRKYHVFKPTYQLNVSEEKVKNTLFNRYFGEKQIEWLTEKNEKGIYHWEHLKQKYYHGGMSWTNEKWVGKYVKNVYVFDYKSSYPARLYSLAKSPYGEAIIGDTDDVNYDYKLRKITIKKDMVIEKGYRPFIPFLRLNNNGTPLALNWLGELDEITNFDGVYLSECEYQHFIKLYHSKNPKIKDEDCYDVEVEYSFKSKPARFFFGDYIEFWFTIKEQAKKEHNSIMAAIAKLMLNSLYGKFGTNIERESNYWDNEDGDWVSYTTNTIEDGDLTYYIPFAIFTTAEGRMALVDSIGNRDDRVAQGDTDSFMASTTLGKKFLFNFDKMKDGVSEIENLGKCDCENDEKSEGKALHGVFRRSKQYGLWCGRSLVKFAYAGINTKVSPNEKEYTEEGYELDEENFETVKNILKPRDLIYGKIIPNQLESVKVANYGVLLCKTDKRITPIWDFEERIGQYRYTRKNYEKYLIKDGWK